MRYAICLLQFLLISSSACSANVAEVSVVECFDIPYKGVGGDLKIRRPDPKSQNLLLSTHAYRIYEFDGETGTLRPLEREAWGAAKGEVTSFSSGPTDRLSRGIAGTTTKYRLIMRTPKEHHRELPTVHEFAMRVSHSVTWAAIAVLTADSRPNERGHIDGTFFIEFFDLPGGRTLGKPVELAFSGRDKNAEFVWSADGEYLVIRSLDERKICVIRVPEVPDNPIDEL